MNEAVVGHRPGRAAGRWARVVAVFGLVLASLAVVPNPAAQAQFSGIGLSIIPGFLPSYQVGAQNQAAVITIINNSQGNVAPQPVTISNIQLNPACATSAVNPAGDPCPARETGNLPGPIFNVDPIATGRAGTACAGVLFAVSPPNANGTVTLTPTLPVVLGPSSVGGPLATCLIDFTFDVFQRPTDGQTFAVVSLQATAPDPLVPGGIIGPVTQTGASSIIVVTEAPSTIVTTASPQTVNEGTVFSDTATVTGVPFGPPLTDSVFFELYRSAPGNPGFPTCTAAELVTTGTVQVVAGPPAANGAPTATATFTPLPPPGPGRYVFVATYDPPGGPNPDINYLSSTSACGDPLEQVTVNPVLPSIAVEKTANPTVVSEPGGPVTFTVRVINTGPRDVTLTSLTDNVYGDLNGRPGSTCVVAPAGSTPPTPPLLTANGGTYTCTFVGQVPPTGAGVPGTNHVDIVTAVATDTSGQTATAQDDAVVTIVGVPPVITVIKDASPLSRPEPGGTFTFTVRVRNDSPFETVTINSLNDDVYGNLATIPGSTCGALIGTMLAPGATSAPCTFPGNFTGSAGATQTDIVTVVATDDDGQTDTDDDDATVGITDVRPTVRVVKTATPLTRPAPGGTFTFSAVVTNTSAEPITITGLNDDIYGNLATTPGSTCGALIGTTLAPGASSAPCTFPGTFTGAAGATQTDVVTVTATDDEGNIVTDDDDATVTITGAPLILVDKSAEPSSLPEPGGTFTFRVVVTNVGPEPLTITSLNDDIYGNVATIPGSTCGALIGTTLAPGASSAPCTFPGNFTGPGGAQQTDIVTVVGTSPAGTTVTDTDDATVRITNVAPTIAVVKTASPLTRPAPGGTFTFTVVVRNTSAEPVTITTLSDDIYGDIATRPGSTCGALIGTTLAPGASSAPCTFTGDFTGAAGAAQTDIVTATATDQQGTVVTATDDATVSIINIVPDISVDKTATPTTRPAPGGTFTFNVVVTNTGPNSLTITTLTDDIYGNLATRGTCTTAIGTVLPSGGSYTCAFDGTFTGAGGAVQTDVVTVTATDVNGTVVTDNDDATVSLTSVTPTVRVDKTANPLSLPEPGGTFTFTAVVTNTGTNPVTITSLNDNVFGNLFTRPGSTCGTLQGTVLAPGASSAPCTFPGNFFGEAGASETDVVTVVVTDTNGTTATDDDEAVVTITNVLPTIDVVKTAMPLSRPAPGGPFTFTVVVTNTSFEPVTITSLMDNVYGTLNGRGTCAIGAVLAPNGGTYTCAFDGDFTGAPNASQTDIVTVLAVDNDGTTVTDFDDATVTLTPPPATLTTQVSAGSVGAQVFDTATLAGGFNPTGTITFQLYNNETCTGTPLFTNVKPVTGTTDPRIIVSDPFILPAPGIYHFVATYSGDANNAPIGPTPCLEPSETIGVGRLPIQFSTQASPGVVLGGGIFDTATIAGGFNPTGTVTFTVYGPNDATCTATPVFTSVKPVNGNGNYISDTFVPTAPGVYRFVASYSGDTNNAPTITPCNDPLEQVTVTPPPVGPPAITTTKTANPTSHPEPGGTFTFTLTVRNTGPNPVTVTALVDDVYGNLNGRGTCAVGAVLAANGGTYTCNFTGNFVGNAGATQTDTITTTAVDNTGQTVTSQSQATVTITNVPPTITLTKSADPLSRPAPGGSFRFTVVVTNTSFEPVTITSLVDDIYGDLNGRGSCAVGVVLAPNGGSYSCAFDGNFTGAAGASQTDTVTAVATDDDGTRVTAIAKATVTLTAPGTPPVVPPPPTPPPVVQPPQPLVRTGSELAGPARLAGILLLVGMTLIAATRRFGEGGPGLVTVPAGPRGPSGPGRGRGGPGAGGSPFGGAPARPPRPRPQGGAGFLQPPPPPKPEPRPPQPKPVWDAWVEQRPVPEVGAADAEVAGEIVVPTVVQIRATGALDAAALEAAASLGASTRPSGPPDGKRRSGRRPERR